MQANGLSTFGVSKQEKSQLNQMLEEMFDEADEWLSFE
jgi:hypothetical protein